MKIVFYFSASPAIRHLSAAARSLTPEAYVVVAPYAPAALRSALQFKAEIVAHDPPADVAALFAAALEAGEIPAYRLLPDLDPAVDMQMPNTTNVALPVLINTAHSEAEAKVWRAHFFGQEPKEIATGMGITEQAVRTLLARARAKNEDLPEPLANLARGSRLTW